MVPFPPTSKMFHTKRLLVWLEALWGSSVEVEAGWHWRPILYKPPCAWCLQGQFTTSLPREHQRLPYIWSGAEIIMWSHGEEEIPCFADQNLQSSQKSRGSKPNWPEEQLWKYLSTQGAWENQGSGRLSRAIPLKHRQQWLGQKHGSEELIRPLLLLPPPAIYARADIRQWELKNWWLESTVEHTGHILAEKRGY